MESWMIYKSRSDSENESSQVVDRSICMDVDNVCVDWSKLVFKWWTKSAQMCANCTLIIQARILKLVHFSNNFQLVYTKFAFLQTTWTCT